MIFISLIAQYLAEITQKLFICGLFFLVIETIFLGVITTVGATYGFLSLMTLYPEKQRKLQQEVDDVIGGRLPRLADRPKMHYMEAVNLYHPRMRVGNNFNRVCLYTQPIAIE